MSDGAKDFGRLEAHIGHTFRDPALLERALTHPSWANERRAPGATPRQQNQRLEFLGDAVLGMLVATALFEKEAACDEGSLTRYLSGLVCEPALAKKAREIELGDFLRLGRGEEAQGGRDRDSILCDCYEALLAAVYLDGGFEVAGRMVRRLHAPEFDTLERHSPRRPNPKGRLQKIVQARWRTQPSYAIVAHKGPEHGRIFVAQVSVGGQVIGQGEGGAKRVAEQAAAKAALEGLEPGPLARGLG